MSLTNDQITAQNFKDYHNAILPYLNGQCPPIANKFAKSDIYSIDEHIVGSWQGKPLYQKTITGLYTPNSQNSNVVIHEETNTHYEVCLIDAAHSYALYEGVQFLPLPHAWQGGLGIYAEVNGTTMKIHMISPQGGWMNCPAVVTINYTKTTDDPIAIGDESDYSTDEKIVGTWIDGKPVYQRTFTPAYSGTGRSTTIEVGDAPINIDRAVNAFVSCVANQGTCKDFIFYDLESVRVENNKLVLFGGSNGATNVTNLVCTIQYTKTTD